MKISLELLIRILHCKNFLPQLPIRCEWSFIQLQPPKIKTEFLEILLLFNKFMKKFFFIKLQFQSLGYSVYVFLEIVILVIGIILRFGN